jgi:hypothetical protein
MAKSDHSVGSWLLLHHVFEWRAICRQDHLDNGAKLWFVCRFDKMEYYLISTSVGKEAENLCYIALIMNDKVGLPITISMI